MVPFPSVPTDSLYKFMALGGVITLLTLSVLFVTETEKLAADDIELKNNVALIDLRIDGIRKALKDNEDEFRKDSIARKKEIKLEKLRHDLAEVFGIPVNYRVAGKIYTYEQYQKYLSDDYYNSISVYNKHIKEQEKLAEPIPLEKLKIKKQEDLLKHNKEYHDDIYYVVFVISFLSLIVSGYGFKQWRRLQRISDELSELQLAKARKEIVDDKPKLILPN